MMKKLLLLAAAFLALPATAPAQTASAEPPAWGCGGLPATQVVIAEATRLVLHMEIATTTTKVCLGTATRMLIGTSTRYRVQWRPCPNTTTWRYGGDSTSMTSAMKAAARPPACSAAGFSGS